MTAAPSLAPSSLADRLALYNRWRRGDDVEPPAPVELGRDIDAAVELLRRVDELMDAAALALPYVEGADRDSMYKRDAATKLARRIRTVTEDIRR